MHFFSWLIIPIPWSQSGTRPSLPPLRLFMFLGEDLSIYRDLLIPACLSHGPRWHDWDWDWDSLLRLVLAVYVYSSTWQGGWQHQYTIKVP